MPDYFEFEVTLRDAKPKIWRRFLISTQAKFIHLHEAIQDACGWRNCHLFLFQDPDGEAIAGIPSDEDDEPDPDARKVKLTSYFGKGRAGRCIYEYDFGDAWEHAVILKNIVRLPEAFGRRLVDGARAFPPEDCGGLGGYQECVRVAKGGKDPEGLRKWMSGWDPERFDLEAAKKRFYQSKLSLRGFYEEMTF